MGKLAVADDEHLSIAYELVVSAEAGCYGVALDFVQRIDGAMDGWVVCRSGEIYWIHFYA